MHGGSCISSYSCISHGSSDYCVKNVGPVYETIKVLAYDDSLHNDDMRVFTVHFTDAGYYSDNEFYGNDTRYSVESDLSKATLQLYDAHSGAFCIAVPSDPSCA